MKKTLIMKLAKILAKFEEVVTDKAVLTADGAIEVGVEVYVLDAEGEYKPAEDGEYVAENGDVLVVAESKIAEIRKHEEEPIEEPVEEVVEEVIETVVEEMAEEPIVEEVVEEPVETPAEPEMDEKDRRIAELEAEIAEKDEKISALEAQLTELAKPLEEPVEMSKTPKAVKTSNPALRYFE